MQVTFAANDFRAPPVRSLLNLDPYVYRPLNAAPNVYAAVLCSECRCPDLPQLPAFQDTSESSAAPCRRTLPDQGHSRPWSFIRAAAVALCGFLLTLSALALSYVVWNGLRW